MHVGSHVHRNLEFFDGERPEVQETTGASVQLSEWLPIGTDDDFIGEPCRRCGSASGRRSWPDIRRGERGGWVVGSRAMRWSSAWAVVPVRMAVNSASPTAPVTLYLQRLNFAPATKSGRCKSKLSLRALLEGQQGYWRCPWKRPKGYLAERVSCQDPCWTGLSDGYVVLSASLSTIRRERGAVALPRERSQNVRVVRE